MLANTSKAYDPIAYNNGGVWPFLTGFAAMGEYQYHRSISGFHHLLETARLAEADALGFSSEIWSGDYYRPLDTSVPHQLFSSGMTISPFMRGLVGLSGDAISRRLTLAPHLPEAWDSVDVKRYRVGEETFSLALSKSAESFKAIIDGSNETSYELIFSPGLPPLSTIRSVAVNGRPAQFKAETSGQDIHATLKTALSKRTEIEIKFSAGVEVDVPVPDVKTGARTEGMKVLGLEQISDGVKLTVEGLVGRKYRLRARSGSLALKAEGARAISSTGPWKEFEIDFEGLAPGTYVKKTIQLVRSR